MKILVLGCGPAGLMSAHAAAEAGHDVIIASKKRKSEMYGAQYLHAPIPGMTAGDPVRVEYLLNGDSHDYRRKVYGSARVQVSPDTLEESHDAWDIRQTYGELWRTYGDYVKNAELSEPSALDRIIDDLGPDRIYSSIPAPFLCQRVEEHNFYSEEVWAIGDAPERGVFCPVKNVPDNTIQCDGTVDVGWYRASNVFGYRTAEWPHHKKPPFEGVAMVTKPLKTDCTCLPTITRVGRYGRWTKGVLSHSAYYETQADLEEMRLF